MGMSAPGGPTQGSTRKRRTTSGPTPAHVLAQPGDDRVLCGLKRKDVLPLVWEPYVDRHVKGWGMPVCPSCAARMSVPGESYARSPDGPKEWGSVALGQPARTHKFPELRELPAQDGQITLF